MKILTKESILSFSTNKMLSPLERRSFRKSLPVSVHLNDLKAVGVIGVVVGIVVGVVVGIVVSVVVGIVVMYHKYSRID